MKSSKIELLEKRLFGELDRNEKYQFDLLLVNDVNFASDYSLITEILDYSANNKLYDLREKLNIIHDEEVQTSTSRIIRMPQVLRYAASIAAVMLIVLGSYYLIDRQTNTDALFQQYYHIDEVYLNTRGGDAFPASKLEEGLVLFENNEYQRSLEVFESLSGSITATYYSGVANMELGEYDIAIFKFDQVIENYLNVFYDQANWYKGLCLVKNNKLKEAKKIFTSISKSDSYYKNQAKEILEEIK